MFLKSIIIFIFYFYEIVNAHVKLTTFTFGKYTINFVYNNETISNSYVAITSIDESSGTIGIQTVTKTGATTNNFLCRQNTQKRVALGPNGCSNFENIDKAVQSSNCIKNEIEIVLRREILKNTWYLSKNSNLCNLRGGNGDIRLCPGPIRLARENKDSFIEQVSYSVKDIYMSRMIFLDSLSGPFAMIPTVIEVDIEKPPILVDTTCIDSMTSDIYYGNYTPIETDGFEGFITDIWKSFETDNPALRLLITRSSSISLEFKILLVNILAPNNEYNIEYESVNDFGTVDLINSPTIFPDWIDAISANTTYTMRKPTNHSDTCTLEFTFPTFTEANYVLNPPEKLTSNNFMYNKLPRRYLQSRMCNAMHGRLDQNGKLVYPNCPEGDRCGGNAVFVHPSYPQLPVYVPANPNLDFRFHCNEYYPKGNTFQDINDVTVPRISITQEHCFAPFLSNYLIESNTLPNEKYTQCHKLGMYVWGRSKSHCAAPITQIKCKKNWFYFDERCFYRFSINEASKFTTTQSQADNTCKRLSSEAIELREVDSDTETWLINNFIYFNQDIDTKTVYRVPKFASTLCSCFITIEYIVTDCPCEIYQLENELPVFPICFYQITNAKMEPDYSDYNLLMETALLLVNGQEGPKSSGHKAICKCQDGWGNEYCENPTCSVENILEADPSTLNKISIFFRKCYTQNQGSCYNGMPRNCKCNYPYGPSASIIPTYPSLYEHKDNPCSCPASSKTIGNYMINGKIYKEGALYLPCDGIDKGECIVDNSTNIGTCSCSKRINLVFNLEEDAYDGRSCACSVPIQPFNAITKNGPIVSANCNNHGTCCPFGETTQNPLIGNIHSDKCFDENKTPISGCSCDNGYGGPACTCITPYDRAENRKIQQKITLNLIYINLEFKYFITTIKLKNCGLIEYLKLSNEVGKDAASVECTFNGTLYYHKCDTSTREAYQYIVIKNGNAETCQIKAYEEDYVFCGANNTINPFSGRFSDIETFRGPQKNLEQQFLGTANYGCTNTDCMCNSNYGGKKCALKTSSIRPVFIKDLDQTTRRKIQAKQYCGESILLPTLTNEVRGRGQPDPVYHNCSCNAISNEDHSGSSGIVQQYFTEEACECAMMYNRDRNDILMCAGHGTCSKAKFEYGKCEVDITKLLEDSLSSPFISVISFETENTEMIATTDVYFLTGKFITTQQPTMLPSFTPTIQPTKLPTYKPSTLPTYTPSQQPTN